MKLSMLTGVWRLASGASLAESLSCAAALGFHYVDIHGVFHGGPQHLDAQACREVALRMADLGLVGRNYVLHPPTNPAAAGEAETADSLDYLKRGFDYAATWGINQIMLNAGQWTYGASRREAWQRSVRFLQQVCDAAARWNIFVAQETEPYVWFLVNDLASARRMADDVARPNFTLLADLGHMGLAREAPQDLLAFRGEVIHVHLSDHQAMLHTNQPVGSGATPTADYLTWLREEAFDAQAQRFGYTELAAGFELGVPGGHIDDPDAWVRRSIDYLRAVAPWVEL